jgi:transcriptional regulator of heat shock response
MQYLERTSHVLALISSGLGVAVSTSTAQQILEHIHFSRLSTGRVLAVLVTRAGAVQDRVLAIDRELGYDDLEMAARYLNENFRGWPLDRIRAEVARRIEAEQAEYQNRLQALDELCRQGALAADPAAPMIYVEGMANLLAGEMDRERLRQMLMALEAKQRLVELLNAYVDARQHEVRVVVGLDGSEACLPCPIWCWLAPRRVLVWKAGNRRRHRPDPHAISGDDSGSQLHCPAFGSRLLRTNAGRHPSAIVFAMVHPAAENQF